MSSKDEAGVVAYDPEWPATFATLAMRLRRELGAIAQRIDHIGSTAVPGLAAKPMIDVQISVASLEPIEPFSASLERCGFLWRPDNPDLTKRYFRERHGAPRTHIHVRRSGSLSEQLALLFRDYLRAHRDQANLYAAEKRRLAHLLARRRADYVEYWRHGPDGGQHGYDPGVRSMRGLFVAAGPAFKAGRRVPAFENVDVYNVLAAALGVEPSPNDGDPEAARSVLR